MGGGHPWSLVTADLEALLTALYVLIDDHVIEPGRRRPGRPRNGVYARIAQRLLALAACIWDNWRTSPANRTKRSLIAYDH